MKSSKKILTLVFVLAMLFTLSVMASAEGVLITVETVEVEAGTETAEVILSLSDNPGITGIVLNVTYDENLILTKADQIYEGLSTSAMTVGGSLSANPIKIMWDNVKDDTNSGDMAKLTFTLPADAEGEYPISVEVESAMNFDLDDVTVGTLDGAIKVKGASAPTITVETVEVEAGTETAEVILSLSDNPGITGVVLNVTYDENLILTKADQIYEGLSTSAMTVGGSLSANPIRIMWDNVKDDTNSGDMAKLTFTLPADAEGEYPISVDVESAMNFDLDDVDINVVNGSIVVKTAEEPPVEPIVNTGYNLYLDGGVAIKQGFKYDAETYSLSDITVEVTLYDTDAQTEKTFTVEAVEEENNPGQIFCEVEVAAKDYDNVTVTFTAFIDADTYSQSTPGTVKKIIDYYLENNNDDEKVKNLVKALDVYCMYADSFFGAQDAEDIELTADENATIAALAAPARLPNGKIIGDLEFYGSSIFLNSKITIRHYFKVTEGADLTAYEVAGALDFVEGVGNNEGYAYVDIENISIEDLDCQQITTIEYGEEAMDVYFSVLNYVGLNYEDEDAPLSNLVKALYRYCVAAEAYTA